ncbi:MAG TPA: LPS assembly protein LptD [Terriglobales bacterium]|nr:LPS assembly protein LptD [Terriglobales bacterium]
MTSRTRFLITAAFICHLLLAPCLVTSQWLSPAAGSSPAQSLPNTPSALNEEDVTISAITQEKSGPIYKLHGKAEIHYGVYVLRADEVTYNAETGESTADGHVALDGGSNDDHLQASHGTYNVRAESGRFENVTGTIGVRMRGTRIMLTSSNPFFFTGKVVEKTGPDHYMVYDGTVTTCELPHPKWQFNANKVVVNVGGTAKIYHSTFGIKGIPILYFPFATLPAERLPRQSGFLIPNIGTSSVKGTILGESLFWAINRSMDAHIGAEYFSARGWAPQGEFRARPSDTSFVDLNFFSVLDRGAGNPSVNQGGEEVRLNAEGAFGHNFRGVANVDYLSSFVFRLAFNDVFAQAVNSEVKSDAFLSNTTRGFFYNASMQRYQDFESTTAGDVITILHAPSFEVSSVDRQLGHSPFYWSYEAAAEGLSRSEPGFSTAALVGRFDLNPSLSLPLKFGGWSIRPELSLRDTSYTQQLAAAGSGVRVAGSDPINRRALEGAVEVRPPALSRVFAGEFMGRKWKHVIEPRVAYSYVTGVNNFSNILRFDERDILTNTNEVEYSLVNRLYTKHRSGQQEDCGKPGMPSLFIGGAPVSSHIPWERQSEAAEAPCNTGSQVREVVTWELAQKYFIDPNFPGALVSGRSNVFASTVDLTGTSFLTAARHLSPLISRLRVQASARTDVEWDVDYDFERGGINTSTVLANYRVGPFTVGGGDAYLQVPGETVGSSVTFSPQLFNQFRLLLGYGHPGKQGFSAATNIGFDAKLGFLQYAAVQTTYNWDCCGVSMEFRRFALGSVRNENQYRFTFALANLGSLGNLRRAEKLF